MDLFLSIAALVSGLFLLAVSADKFVEAASGIAKQLGMPQLLVGMIIVGFGTSAPEMTVSAISSYEGNPQIALGNAYGSNIANIALILGICACIAPVVVRRSAALRELPPLLLVTVISMALLWNKDLSRMDAIILLVLFAIALTFSSIAGIKEEKANQTAEKKPPFELKAFLVNLVKLAVGLAVLIGSSKLLVWGAVELAERAHVSPLIIGLTIVAVGTSLPELASSVAAMRRHEDDIAVGNIIGSNIFNALAVVGIAGIISPMKGVEREILMRDVPVGLALTLALFVFGFPYKKGQNGHLGRCVGVLFLASYVAYCAYITIAK